VIHTSSVLIHCDISRTAWRRLCLPRASGSWLLPGARQRMLTGRLVFAEIGSNRGIHTGNIIHVRVNNNIQSRLCGVVLCHVGRCECLRHDSRGDMRRASSSLCSDWKYRGTNIDAVADGFYMKWKRKKREIGRMAGGRRRIRGQPWVSPGFAGLGFTFSRRSRGSRWRSTVSRIAGHAIGSHLPFTVCILFQLTKY
jgi:hypothetical protein